jgi:phosphoribosylaminoimidazole-succinocarboxamide synthase
MEQAMRCIPFRFEDLELLVEGESKEVRLLTEYVVVERLKPTVYSFTHNRYGHVDGTDLARVRFSAEIFRRMEALPKISSVVPRSAFLGLIDTERGPALVQRRVDDSNLEIRVKRYHIGSPLHRYLYTERHPSWQSCGPLERWSRFDEPIVCYDWRHPLKDDEGRALADEPVSDDYAAVWVKDVLHAKEMARATFLWLESMMDKAGLVLVDICVFIDRSGKTIFGEISPDCMRIRSKGGSLDAATSFDKDVWRGGAPGRTVAERYWAIFELLFGDRERLISTGS